MVCCSFLQIFDEQHFVALLIVEQLIHESLGLENAESSRAHARNFPLHDVTKGLLRWISESRMFEFFKRKSSARIFYFAKDCAASADVGHLNVLRRIEFPAMLHGVQKDFAERHCNLFRFHFWQVGCFAIKVDKPLSGNQITAYGKPHPVGCGRENLKAVIPERGGQSQADNFRKPIRRKRASKITEGPLAN